MGLILEEDRRTGEVYATHVYTPNSGKLEDDELKAAYIHSVFMTNKAENEEDRKMRDLFYTSMEKGEGREYQRC